jgi:hypothetical protein
MEPMKPDSPVIPRKRVNMDAPMPMMKSEAQVVSVSSSDVRRTCVVSLPVTSDRRIAPPAPTAPASVAVK